MFIQQECAYIERDTPDWYHAMSLAIRPEQMRRVAQLLRRFVRPLRNIGTADVAASWLGQQFRRGTLRYAEDRPLKPAYDVVCSPGRTWQNGFGDCDDMAAMMTSLLRAMGTPAVFVVGQVWVDGQWNGHAWTEGKDEFGFFLLEATVGPPIYRSRPREYRREMILAPEGCQVLSGWA